MADYTIPENCTFNDDIHRYSSNSCSPRIINPTFEGVLINAPKKVPLSDTIEVKLACSFAFSLRRDLGIFEEVENAIVFTVVDNKTHNPYSGKVLNIDNPIPNPNAQKHTMKREELPDQILGGFVNLDLIKVVRMPKKPGKYIVYATISTFKSNVLEFEIVE